MTPHETLATMTSMMRQDLMEFARQPAMLGEAQLDPLILRGLIRLDEADSWVLSEHGRMVVRILRTTI